jgi:hypothetical protein
MYSRKTRRNSRRRTGSRTALRVSLVAAGGCVPVLVIGYAVAATHSGRAADTADVSMPSAGTGSGTGVGTGSGTGVGGWGRGGYTMMPGPAGSAAPSQGNSATTAPANAAATTSMNWAGYVSTGNQGTFTNVSASWTQPAVTCGATNQPIGDENASALTMVSSAGVTEATPSALTGANAFTVTWDSSGTSTAVPAPAANTGTLAPPASATATSATAAS